MQHTAIHVQDPAQFRLFRPVINRIYRTLRASQWSKNADALDHEGRVVRIDSDDVSSCCLFSTICRDVIQSANIQDIKYLRNLLDRAVFEVSHGRHCYVFDFNDAPETRFEDIRHVLEKAQMLLWRDAQRWNSPNKAQNEHVEVRRHLNMIYRLSSRDLR